MVVFTFLLLLLFVFVCFIRLSLVCPFLATMSSAGYFMSVSFRLLPLLFFSNRVPGLVWFRFAYRVTMAGFVADQLICDEQQQ